MVQRLVQGAFTAMAKIQSLVGELRSHKPWPKKKKESQLSSEPSVSHNFFASGGFEIIQELPKCDPEAGSEQMLLEKI